MHRYYNPELTEGQRAALDRENMAVLAATQAALGNISSDIRALFVDAGSEPFVLHFVVADGRAEACREDIDDTVSEFLAQTWGDEDLDAVARVHVEEVPRDLSSLGWRPVYWAAGWTAWRE
ncbi:hypothetical protein ACGGAQ_32070 [Micromonospora sp. NPDC047557]|uniref:hypothetical protein n=1 Tax=Micromonospora sp. NPDC047557 TaxID=3364250 RepID=UPI003712E978